MGIFNSNAQNYWELEKKEKNEPLIFSLKFKKNKSKIHFGNLNQNIINKKLNEISFLSSKNYKDNFFFFPNENNDLEEFKIHKSSIMSDELSNQYSNIKTFIGNSTSRPEVKIRGTFSPLGLSGMIILPNEVIYIQPQKDSKNGGHLYYKNKNEFYQEYKRLNCITKNKIEIEKEKSLSEKRISRISERKINTFRIAISATASYTDYWGDDNDENGTNRQDAYAAVVSTINRVNEIFETDLGVHLELVSSDSLIYANPSTQPYGSNLGDELQKTLSQNIGESNYDIGHLFAYSNQPDGEAGCIGCVCEDGQKGRAYSTHPFIDISEQGVFLNDYFDIDFVAHEIGHQFGAHHTFSYETEGVGVNVEPGSGSTLMGYAGITGKDDIQYHSDGYFHYVSINEIHSVLVDKSCQNITNNDNTSPIVNAGINTYIPIGTAYELSAIATTTDGDVLTYTWEQLDSGRVSNSNYSSNLIIGSINRSKPPSLNNKRFVPNMSRVLEGKLTQSNPQINDDWESVSTVGRILNWGVTVRERSIQNNLSIGQISQDQIRINVIGDSTPFKINSQNSVEELWGSGSNEMIKWNVGKTSISPIKTETVSIFLSTDGGNSFPIKLISNTPNDGETYISVPDSISTSKARIKIVADNSIYFAVNSVNFSIELRSFSFSLEKFKLEICDQEETSVSFKYNSYLGFTEEVEFDILDAPQGLSYIISPNKISKNDTNIKIEFKNLQNLNSGDYSLILIGKSSSVSYTTSFKIEKRGSNLSIPGLISPLNNSKELPSSTTINWTDQPGVDQYQLQVSETSSFEKLVIDTLTKENYFDVNDLKSKIKYFWKVRAINSCISTIFSDTYNFTTQLISCKDFASGSTPLALQDANSSGFGITYDDIKIPYNLEIEDVNVTLSINHDYVSDLTLTLISPKGKEVILASNIGEDKKNYSQTTFDDQTEFSITEGTPPFTGIFRPFQKLETFKGDMSYGTWRLKIVDNEAQDTGQIVSFKINICLRGEIYPDDDNDSVSNIIDNCPLIANEDQLDLNLNGIGDLCDMEDLMNFKIFKKDESCSSKNNGSVTIIATAEYDYIAKFIGPNNYRATRSFSNLILEEKNLQSGNYLICITSPKDNSFERCFNAVINEPEKLSVLSSVNYNNQSISLTLNGADIFDVSVNDIKMSISKSTILLNLKKGLNVIKVNTDLICQGVYEEFIYIDQPSIIYPNPVKQVLSILVGGSKSKVQISIYDLQGNFIKNKTIYFIDKNRKIEFLLNRLITGSYFVKLNHGHRVETIKFIKL